MKKALAMVEYKTVSSGMQAADIMVKTADVEVIEATTVCPGKYMVLISGELSAVRAAVEAAAAKLPDSLIDKFVLGNPHESIFTALYGTTDNIFGSINYCCGRCCGKNIACRFNRASPFKRNVR